MRLIFRCSSSPLASVAIAMALMIPLLPMREAGAADVLGLYVGAAVGQSRVEADIPSIGDFKENHSAFKVMAGIRPISLVGAEVSYIDFGHPTGSISDGVTTLVSSDASQRGTAAFGVLYLPVPLVDVFVKAGAARLQSTETTVTNLPGVGSCTVTDPGCGRLRLSQNRTNTGFAAGAGAQFKFGSFAVRAEYERFDAAGGNPNLASLGLTWTFF